MVKNLLAAAAVLCLTAFYPMGQSWECRYFECAICGADISETVQVNLGWAGDNMPMGGFSQKPTCAFENYTTLDYSVQLRVCQKCRPRFQDSLSATMGEAFSAWAAKAMASVKDERKANEEARRQRIESEKANEIESLKQELKALEAR